MNEPITKSVGRRRKYQMLYDENFLRDRYLDQKLPMTDIAKEIGCSYTAVVCALKKAEIPIRRYTLSDKVRNRQRKGKKK